MANHSLGISLNLEAQGINSINTIGQIDSFTLPYATLRDNILTEMDSIKYAPRLSETGNSLAALLQQAQIIAESTLGANRILAINQWIEKKFISYDYQSFYLGYVNQYVPLLETPDPIQIRIRHENFKDSFGRNNGGTTDWELLDDSQYATQVDGQVNLKLLTSNYYGGYYNQSCYSAYAQRKAKIEVEVTYYSGFDFSEESPQIKEIKTWTGMIAEHLASANYQGVNKLVVPFREYEISFANSQPGLVPMGLLLPFKRFQPLTSIL